MEEGWNLESGILEVSSSLRWRPSSSSDHDIDLLGCYIESDIVAPLPVLQMKPGPSRCPALSPSFWFTADFQRYIVLNRNGSANELEITSRNFNPLVLFNEMKYVCLWKTWSTRHKPFGLIVSQASKQPSPS